MNTSSGSIPRAVEQSLNVEYQPPLYFVILTIWRKVNGSLFWARTFSLLSLIGAVFFINKLRDLSYLFRPKSLVPVFLLNPMVIFFATEARLYAFLVLITAILLWLYLRIFLSIGSKTKNLFFYGLVAIAALYTQYYAGLILFANGIWLLFHRRWKLFASYAITMIFVLLALTPLALHSLSTIRSQFQLGEELGFLGSLERTLRLFLDHLLLGFSDSPIPQQVRVIVRGLIVFALVWPLFSIKRSSRRRCIKWFESYHAFSIALSLSLLIAFFSWLPRDLVQPRHLAFLVVLAIPLFYKALSKNKRRWIRITAITLVLTVYISSAVSIFSGLYKNHPWRAAAEYVEANEVDNQPIFAFTSSAGEAFQLYYHGQNDITELPNQFQYKANWESEMIFTESDRTRMSPLLFSASSCWLLLDQFDSYAGRNFNRHIVEEMFHDFFNFVHCERFDSDLLLYQLVRSGD
jgi:hypothetical protein